MNEDGPGSPLLSLRDVERIFVDGERSLHVLKGVTFTVNSGDSVAICGPSGSGKTTLLGLMAGLDRPTSGALELRGEAFHGWSEDRLSDWRRREVGFIFQDFRLLPRLTAQENVALPLELLGIPPAEAALQAQALLETVGVGDRLDHLPAKLSGGEQQRVAIVRAFAHRPMIVFADEPTGNLDPETSRRVMDLLVSNQVEHGTALVLVTHDQDAAARMRRRVELRAGRIA